MPRSLQDILDQAESLAAHFEEGFEPDVTPEVAALRAAAHRRAQAEADVAHAVQDAVASGATWTTVGTAVGTSGQAARERYKDVVVRRGSSGSTSVSRSATSGHVVRGASSDSAQREAADPGR